MEEFTLDKVFGSPAAKVCDLYPQYQDSSLTTSTVAKAIGVSFKTALKAIEQLESLNLMMDAGKIRNAKAYKFNKDSKLLNCIKPKC